MALATEVTAVGHYFEPGYGAEFLYDASGAHSLQKYYGVQITALLPSIS